MYEEWENIKSRKFQSKYKTGHTYRNIPNSLATELKSKIYKNSENNVEYSLNKNKNWNINEIILNKLNQDSLHDFNETKNESKNKKRAKQNKEQSSAEINEPVIKIHKNVNKNELIYDYTFQKPSKNDANKDSLNTNELFKQEQKKLLERNSKKTVSRKAQRKLSDLSENDDNGKTNSKNKEDTVTYSFEVPITSLSKGKCWKHKLPNIEKSNNCNLIRNGKHSTQGKLLAYEDSKCVVRTYLKVNEKSHAQAAISQILSKKEDILDDNCVAIYKPLVGVHSFVNKENLLKEYSREFYANTKNSSNLLEESTFTTRLCAICFEESSNLVKINDCNHQACSKCLRDYVLTNIASFEIYSTTNLNSEKKLGCIFESCDKSISVEALAKILTHDEIKRYVRHYCDLKVLTSTSGFTCKKENCNNFIVKLTNSSIVVCGCNAMICNKCSCEAHYPISCEDAVAYKQVLNCSSHNYILQGKYCPKCHNFIEKNGGCEHIHCICRHDFCWECLGDFQPGHLCGSRIIVKATAYSTFTMEKIKREKFTKIVTLNDTFLLDSSKRLRAIESILGKLRTNSIQLSRIYYDEKFVENDENNINLLREFSDNSNLKLFYIYLKQISFHIDQFNTICKYIAFQVFEKQNEKAPIDIYSAVKLCEKMNKLFLNIKNWSHLYQLVCTYNSFKAITKKFDVN